MNILLATYNFYPYNWGGSEVYVAGLAQHLRAAGKQIRLIAAVPEQAFTEHGVWWAGEGLRVCRYTHEGITVLGVQHPQNTQDIYQKYQPAWEADWLLFFSFLQTQEKWEPQLLHLHGFTAVIGLALVKAFQRQFVEAPIHASYHTPISCPKGTLLRWEKNECNIQANTSDCSACSWQAKTDWPQWASSLAMQLLPKRLPDPAPTGLQWKALVGSAVHAFQDLQGLVTKWWVFSNQMQEVLRIQGVEAKRIQMGRHGTPDQFTPMAGARHTNGPVVFAFVGRFKKIKGLHTLLKAWQILPTDINRELWLVGDETEADPEISALLQELSTRKDIVLLGRKSGSDLVAIYQQVQAVVVPSEWVEIGPLVVHEAVACGANVIASSIGGTRELAQHYPAVCQLFSFGNVAALRQAILSFNYRFVSPLVEREDAHYAKVLNWYTATA